MPIQHMKPILPPEIIRHDTFQNVLQSTTMHRILYREKKEILYEHVHLKGIEYLIIMLCLSPQCSNQFFTNILHHHLI